MDMHALWSTTDARDRVARQTDCGRQLNCGQSDQMLQLLLVQPTVGLLLSQPRLGARPLAQHRGVALRMVEGRDPGPDEPRLVTPDWALDAAAVQGAVSVETIASLGVEVYGNLETLGVRAPSSLEHASSPDQMPIDAAVAAVAAVIDASKEEPTARELAGRAWRQARKDGFSTLLRNSDS